MSRLFWALAETRRRGRLVHGAGERRRFDSRLCLERRLLPSAVSAAKYTVILLAAGALVLAAEPARALAESSRGVAQTYPSTPPALPAGTVALAFGGGYGGGSNAAHVRALQRRLNSVRYSPGPIDGRYGPRTELAVELFQSAHGLRVDGVAGPITLTALRTPSTVFFPGAGYSGPGSGAVRGLQRRLRRDGYSSGPIDGRYGPLTTQAVRDFQAAHGLHVDGIAGPQTFGELKPVANRQRPGPRATVRPRPKPSSPPTPRRTIHPRPSHPGTPRATRANGSSWPVVLVLAGLIGLATLAGGAWLLGRRRRGLKVSGRSPGEGTATAAPAGSDLPDPTAELIGPVPVEQAADTKHALEVGLRLVEGGDMAGAERAYRYADERGDAIGASNLGVLLEHRGDLAGAEAAYRRADAKGNSDGAFNLAAMLVERGDTEGAMAAYRRADRRGDAAAAANLGVLLERAGDLAAAEAAYRRADEREHPNGAFNLGALLEERGDLEDAVAAYRRADVRGDHEAPARLGMLLEQVGDFPGAAHAYSRAAERGHAQGAFRLGALLERHNDPQGALWAYERAQTCEQPEVAEMARARVLALSQSEGEER
jgi:peptidoglycan hydrolase-like protein with peptidoglycan-binding domain/TPR repeat protein